ncbi:MAG: transposase [Candidatus Heimdallarchaeota archaeon]
MENQLNLFDLSKYKSKPKAKQKPSLHLKRKFSPINRSQITFKIECLDSALPLNHDARTVWNFVEHLDLSKADIEIASLQDCSGRPAINPRVLIALWIYGISEGIVSARKIAKFTLDHRGFAWICGGTSVGHHLLSKFRSNSANLFEELVIQSVSFLVFNKLIELKEVSQDGVKIQSFASKDSFRRKKTLKDMKVEITQHVRKLEDQLKRGFIEKQERNNKKRELQDALQKKKRLKESLNQLEVFKNQKNNNRIKCKNSKLSNKEIKGLRVSTTEPESRKMRMADGSFKSAYNFQISTEAKSEVVIGIKVTQSGTDGGQMYPMYELLQNTYNRDIDRYLVDRGFKSLKKEVVNNGKRIDKLGLQLAELADDAPTIEEFDSLGKRVTKLEHHVPKN